MARSTTSTAVVPAPATIDNPVINSPFLEPTKHFPIVDGQVAGEPVDGRRSSEFFVPIAVPKKRSPQLGLQLGVGVRQELNETVNAIRYAVRAWRDAGYPHTTSITRELLT